ncbi:MAG TPA: hypothetical protein VMU10_01470 [Desulfomonilia bacterium]|nr:hypothetical protein [Desulfomonilia bacterium]
MALIEMMQREKDLVEKLNKHLQKELDLISEGDIQTLEESMPHKQKLLKGIIENREGSDTPQGEPMPEYAEMMRSLQQDLVVLWKMASGLNDLSKQFVVQRLNEIDDQLEIFFAGLKDGYSKDGKKSSISLHTIKTGA